MTAAVYAREIREQYDCGRCQVDPSEWDRLGRCVEPIMCDGEAGGVRLRIDGKHVPAGAEYPETFATCPMGLLRADLRHDAVAVATLVSHAAAAEVDKRWPAIPARLASLLHRWRVTEAGRMMADHEAAMQGMEAGRGR